MSTRGAAGLLYDSEASLRLVDRARLALRDSLPGPDGGGSMAASRRAGERVERALLLDRLDEAPEDGSARALRDEFSEVVARLGPRGVTARQIDDASGVLVEVETKLRHLAQIFDSPHPEA